jgi:predicted transcriptional regulator
MERLTAQEESVMLYIWKLGSCFIRDILNEMPDPKPPYTSVASVVRNLEKKRQIFRISERILGKTENNGTRTIGALLFCVICV